jgi:cobalt/nickel transport protein
MKITTKLWIGLGVLILLSPLGILLPEHFKAGAAWGEWGIDEIKELAGYIPKGLEKLAPLWNAPLPDYAFKGWEEKGLSPLSLAYIVSAIVGMAIIVGATLVIGRLLTRKGK